MSYLVIVRMTLYTNLTHECERHSQVMNKCHTQDIKKTQFRVKCRDCNSQREEVWLLPSCTWSLGPCCCLGSLGSVNNNRN